MISTMSAVTAAILAGPEWANGPWQDGGGPPWPLGPLLLTAWVALIALGFWLIARRRREPSAAERAMGIVAERYARGDITSEEYQERAEELRKRR